MSYSTASHVASLTQNILSGASNFSTSSSPTIDAVNNWLSTGCSIIETYLSSKKYEMPVASTAAVYSWLENLNALYAAGMAEMSRSNVTLGPGERTRGQAMIQQFWDELKLLSSMDLTTMGVSRLSDGKLYAGGISISDKQTYESNSDRTAPRFHREQFRFSGTIAPTTSTAS